MQQVRRGAFETNSSSSHSLTIIPGSYIPDMLNVDSGYCDVYPGEFGWAEETFTDAPTKASYCLTFIKNYTPEKERTQLESMLVDVIKEVTGAEAVEFKKSSNKYNEWGYIDHQSCYLCAEEGVFNSRQSLRDFIFNPDSVLRTDNDNH